MGAGEPGARGDDGRDPAVVVALASYRRADELAHTLPLILEQLETASWPGRVLVVDNDPEGTARPVVDALGDVRVAYVQEVRPGIAAARNRALDSAPDDDLLIFIDDDETPRPGWLTGLLGTYARDRPAAVVGPVVSEYADEVPEWITAGGFFERRRMPTGTAIDVAATNNLLLDLRQIRALGLRFDADFGLSGGSDTLFTRQLARSGARMVWCDEAIVVDHVPLSRMTRRWVLMRAMRYGNSWSRTSVVLASGPVDRTLVRARMVGRGAARVVGGGIRLGIAAVTRSTRLNARGLRTVMKGVGFVRGAVGSTYTEYARTPVAPSTPVG
ncbi:glycosyltransferase [Nakamurella flavida]|uniref:Glycosyltransferase n=1 Tax=Nakamurella flavida TaxID=363630 RepID=A0A939C649_9ACTN|nr:glycosyltransferase [Nakamurella flavida]